MAGTSIPSWTVNTLRDKLAELKASARREFDRHAINNGRIVNLKRLAGGIRNAKDRAAAYKAIDQLAQQQQGTASLIRSFNAKWKSAVDAAKRFLASVNVGWPKGLGEPISIVTAATVVLVLAAIAMILKIQGDNTAAEKRIAARSSVVNAILSGQVSPGQAHEILNDLQQNDAPKPGDPLGISTVFQSATPIVLAGAAILLLPSILKK